MKPNAVRDILIRGVCAGKTPVDVFLDWCEEADCRPWPIEEPPPTSWHEDSPGGQRRRVFAHNEFSAFAALREWYRRDLWERAEFDGAKMDGPDGPYTRRHTTYIDAVRGLIDRTDGVVHGERCSECLGDGRVYVEPDCEVCGGRGPHPDDGDDPCDNCDASWVDWDETEPCEDCDGSGYTGTVPNPDCHRILELYALMLRDAGGYYVPGNTPPNYTADIVPGLLHIAAQGWWPARLHVHGDNEDGSGWAWGDESNVGHGRWVASECVPKFLVPKPPAGQLGWLTATEALHALARAIVTATVECPKNDEHSWIKNEDGSWKWRGDCLLCKGSGRVPYLKAAPR